MHSGLMSRKNDLMSLVGTYAFGLVGCWGRRSLPVDTNDSALGPFAASDQEAIFRTAFAPVSVVLRKHRGSTSRAPYYVVQIPVSGASQTRQLVLSYRETTRLYVRFRFSSAKADTNTDLMASRRSADEGGLVQLHKTGVATTQNSAVDGVAIMPGQGNENFLKGLFANITSKYEDRSFLSSWTVTPDLYSLWSCTSAITTELFSDSMNESGVLQSFCSLDPNDSIFSSFDHWRSVEKEVEGGGGNPPFYPDFIQDILLAFEEGVRRETPYCRCVILPLGKRCGVIEHLNRITSEGILLVSIEAGSLPFKSQLQMMSFGGIKPKPYSYQKLGLFIWRNREYLLKYPAPKDVEITYMKWTARALTDPFKANVNLSAFLKAFPKDLRSEKSASNVFEV